MGSSQGIFIENLFTAKTNINKKRPRIAHLTKIRYGRLIHLIKTLPNFAQAWTSFAFVFKCLTTLWRRRTVGPDLEKFCLFGTILKAMDNFFRFYLVFCKILILLRQKCYAIGQVFYCRCPNIIN